MDLDALTRRREGLGSWRTGKPASTEQQVAVLLFLAVYRVEGTRFTWRKALKLVSHAGPLLTSITSNYSAMHEALSGEFWHGGL